MMNLQIPLGIQGAACARVGNALGAGETQRALLITKMSLGLSCQSHPYCSWGGGVMLVYVEDFKWQQTSPSPLSHLSLPVTLSCCESIFLGATKNFIGYIFTSDAWVPCCLTCWTSRKTWLKNLPKFSFIPKKDRRLGLPSAQRLLLRPAVWWPSGERSLLSNSEHKRPACVSDALFAPI